MNLKGKLSTNLSLTGKQAIAGGSGGSGGPTTWSQVLNKPFSTVDTEGGLTIQDDTLMIDTLDTIATIDYVDQQIADIPTPTVNIDNKSIINGQDGLQLNQPFGEWSDVIYGWKPDFEYNGSAWVHTLTQDEKNYCSNELIPDLLLGFRLPIFTWSFGNYGEYSDYTVTQDGTTVTIALDAYHSLVISADDMTATGFTPIDFTLLIEESSVILEQYNIEAGEIGTEQRIHQIPKAYIPNPLWNDIQDKPTIPQADGTSIIDNNGIWSAVGGGGSLSIDNKSLISVNGVVQEAVPIYPDRTNAGERWCISNWQRDGSSGDIIYYLTESERALLNSIDITGSRAFYINLEYPDATQYKIESSFTEESATQYSMNLNRNLILYYRPDVSSYGLFRIQRGWNYYGLKLYFLSPSSDDVPKEVLWNIGKYHKLPAEYILVDNETIVNHNGVLESTASNPDWNNIQNKPTFATVATSGSYYDLSNVPTNVSDFTNDAGYITDSALAGYATEQYVDDAIDDINIPTDVSELNNDVGYITDSELHGYATEHYVDDAIANIDIPQPDGTTIVDNNGIWSAVGGSGGSMIAKMGITISNNNISVNSDLNAFGPVDMGGIYSESVLSDLNTPIGTYIGGGIIKTASDDDVRYIRYTTWPTLEFDSSSTRREKWISHNFTTDANLRRVHAITKYYKWYDNRWFGPYYISGMFIGERINDKYEIKIEGWESILNSIVPIIDSVSGDYTGYTFTFKEDITIDPTASMVPFPFIYIMGRDNIPDPQKINSYFLPIDNSTIKVNSDGNIYSASGGDWNATLRQAGYIANKPNITSGTGTGSIIEGTGNINSAAGYNSHAEGGYNSANGHYSHAEGVSNIASQNQHVQGVYAFVDNATLPFYADMVGNGHRSPYDPYDENPVRQNAEATDWDGNKYLAGDVYIGVTDWSDPQNNSIKLANIPTCPTTTAGTYTLQATVDGNGNITYTWI